MAMVTRRAEWLAFGLLVALTLVAALHWRLGIPPVASMEGYLYRPHHRELVVTSWALPLAVLAVTGLVGGLSLVRRSTTLALVLVFVGALSAQHYDAQLDGPGWRTLIYRFESGHGDFLRAAFLRRGKLDDTLRDFEALQHDAELGLYAPSKPPGIMLVYAGIDALGQTGWFRRWAAPVVAQAEASAALGQALGASAAAAAVLFPLGSALVVFPLFFLALAITGERSLAIAACSVCGSVPSYLIFNGHTDGGLFPFIACMMAALSAWSIRSRKARYAALAAMIGAFGTWISFSILPAFGFAAVAALAVLLREDLDAVPWRLLLKAAVAALLGVAIVTLALAVLKWLGDPALRFARAMAYHRDWKVGMLGGEYAAIGLAEFSVYVGLPTIVLYLIAVLGRPEVRRERAFAIGTTLLIVLQALSSGACETARTWLFLVPFVAVGAVIGARAFFGPRLSRLGPAALVVCNLVLVPVIRSSQGW